MALLGALLALAACDEKAIADLNAPGQADYEVIRTRGQLQAQATGLIDGDRTTHGTQILYFETIGRNLYRIDPAESRYITRLLGTLRNNDFIGNSIFAAPYRTIRGSQLFITAVTNASLAAGEAPLSAAERQAAIGFAQSVKGLQYMRLFESRERNGVAINVNSTSAVPLVCPSVTLPFIAAVLDSAIVNLRAAGTSAFPFTLPGGFQGFNRADTFKEVVFGLRAKVEMWRGFEPNRIAQNPLAAPDAALLTNALALLDSSFYTPSSNRAVLDIGVYHFYTPGSGEISNPLVDLNVFRANPKVIRQDTVIVTYDAGAAAVTDTLGGFRAEIGDTRITSKLDTSSTNVQKSLQGVSSSIVLRDPGSPTDPLAILKNEELVLMRAQILWGLGQYANALTEVNYSRVAAGLAPLTAANFNAFVTPRDRVRLLVRILQEKRLSLLFETASRLVDFRMHGILSALGRERNNNPVRNFPIPSAEATARFNQLPTCT